MKHCAAAPPVEGTACDVEAEAEADGEALVDPEEPDDPLDEVAWGVEVPLCAKAGTATSSDSIIMATPIPESRSRLFLLLDIYLTSLIRLKHSFQA